LIDVQNIFHKMEQRTLRAAYGFYCGKELEGAHEALPDTLATLEVFLAQLERYKDHTVLDSRGETVGPVPSDMAELATFCQMRNNADLMGRLVYDDDGVVVFNFGKYMGQPVKEVLAKDPGYFGWMMQGDFPRYTKRVLQRVKEGAS
jgi:DNA polymerase-3 subunit epsilon